MNELQERRRKLEENERIMTAREADYKSGLLNIYDC